jgi:hypothetical protein
MIKIYKHKFDVDKLIKDLNTIISLCKFEDSFHKHSISIMTKEMCPNSHKEFHNNLPFYPYNVETIPYMNKLWKMFNEISDVCGFRIMRKLPHTAYGIHNDTDAGEIIRMQIPIQTNEECWLAYTELKEIEEGWTKDNTYFKKDLENRFGKDVTFYQLEVGNLYHFNTNNIHTLTNEGDTTRYTLLIDLLITDKSLEFIQNNFTV